MRFAVTGGCGYIGSNLVARLVADGHRVFIYDDWSNPVPKVIESLEHLLGKRAVHTTYGSLLDKDKLTRFLSYANPDGIFHLAGKKSVSESVQRPLDYYNTNVVGTINLLQALAKGGFSSVPFVFSSSCTVYGNNARGATEETSLAPVSPYGYTKMVCEQIIRDYHHSQPGTYSALRYFNPVGAHESGLLYDASSTNLFPAIMAAVTEGRPLVVHGTDYDTTDGTCVRDYIHIDDLVDAHIAVMHKARKGVNTWNVSGNMALTTKQVATAFAKAIPLSLQVVYGPRREGDVAEAYALGNKLSEDTGWRPKRTIEDVCSSIVKVIDVQRHRL